MSIGIARITDQGGAIATITIQTIDGADPDESLDIASL